MPANDVELAEAVKVLLDAETFSKSFDPERVYIPDWDLEKELPGLKVCVYPDLRTASSRERGELNKVYRVGVAFAQRLKERDLEECDGLMQLTQEVADFLELQLVTAASGKAFQNTGWEDRIRFDPLQLTREKPPNEPSVYVGTFLSVISFAYLLLE